MKKFTSEILTRILSYAMEKQKTGRIVFGVLILAVLCMAGNVAGYDTYVGITLTETIPAGAFFYATTTISIPAVGYSKTLNPDADGRWSVGETTYTDLVTLTEGVEYSISISGKMGKVVRVDNPTAGGYPMAYSSTYDGSYCSRCHNRLAYFLRGSGSDDTKECCTRAASGCGCERVRWDHPFNWIECVVERPSVDYSITFIA